jgi:L-aminopeptidase/D-esterase-like protein
LSGVLVGHWSNLVALTGCTVVLCPAGAMGGVSIRGGAPGTRETDALRPGTLTPVVHGILLTGGSAFGLDAAAGVVRYLAEQGVGFPTKAALVPIVAGAVIYDLGLGAAAVRPTAGDGYTAARAAATAPVTEGCVGAGTGATVGKALGLAAAVKSGLGSACLTAQDGTLVAALAVVNAFGEVLDPADGRVLAGPRSGDGFASTIDAMQSSTAGSLTPGEHTTLVVVATDATLTKEQTNALANMADDGIARAVRPAHTQMDGDAVFALATGGRASQPSLSTLGALAAEAAALAIVRAVTQATALGGLPAARDLAWSRVR